MKTIVKTWLTFCITMYSSYLWSAENNFNIIRTFFEGQKVIQFSENRGSAVVLLENGGLYLMNKQLEFTEVTESFDPEVLGDLTCIEAVNESIFYLGTATHSLYLYEDGNVTALNELNTDLPQQINSVDFYAGNLWYDGKVLIATSGNTYISSDLKIFQQFEYSSYPTNVTFLGDRNKALLPDGENRCNAISSNYLGLFSQNSNTVLFPVAENDTLDFKRLNDFAVLRNGYGSFPYNYFAYYATDFGIYTQHISSCSDYFILHFDNTEVHDLEVVAGSGLLRNSMFAASDSGLLWLEYESYAYVSDPSYFLFDGIDSAYIVDYSRFHNHLWVGTNDGLKILTDALLTRESFVPEPFEFDTLDFCASEGYSFNVPLNDQLDIQWYRDNNPIEGAVSTIIHSDIPGHYSVIYNEYSDDTLDVAFLRLDSTFTMRMLQQPYKICPGENKPILRAINDSGYHEYLWYSVERGLESDWNNPYYNVDKGGNYYFTATNCNDYIYVSDTVFVAESQLIHLSFEDQSGLPLCEGDTVFVSGAETAVNFQWQIEYQLLENYSNAYYIPAAEDSRTDIYLTVYDEFGCDLSAATTIEPVFKTPYLSPEDLTKYICNATDYVNFWLPGEYGANFDWEGERGYTLFPVGPGTYPITVSNEVCPDFDGEVVVRLLDPLVSLKETIYLEIGDSLIIPIDPAQPPVFWNSAVKIDAGGSFLYVTSDQEDTVFPMISYFNDCGKEYFFEVHFVEEILGVNDDNGIDIYPNPATNYLIIENKNNRFLTMKLIDLQGKQLLETKIDNSVKNLITIPPDIKEGIYLIQISQKDGSSITNKILIE